MTAVHTSPGTLGDLSWQQAGRLRRDSERDERVPNCRTLFALPASVTEDTLRARLTALVRREEVLRITELSLSGAGRAVYSSDVDLPVAHLSVDSAEELAAHAVRMRHHRFDRTDGPLWEMAIASLPDATGQPATHVCAAFDHLISDSRSLQLFRDALTGAHVGPSGLRQLPYRAWVAEQHRRFPEDTTVRTEAREFWLRYLGGTAPDRATALPFCSDPSGPLSGRVRSIHTELPLTLSQLRFAAGRLKSSPFLLFLAATSSTAGHLTGDGEVTVRVNTSGRRPDYLDTLGYFAEDTPVRVVHPGLGNPRHALAAARSAWLSTLKFQSTPWDYIRAVCGHDGTASLVRRPAQILVNFTPWTEAREPDAVAEREFEGLVGTFQLIVGFGLDGRCHLECQFDPGRFATAGVHGFLDVLFKHLKELSGAD